MRQPKSAHRKMRNSKLSPNELYRKYKHSHTTERSRIFTKWILFGEYAKNRSILILLKRNYAYLRQYSVRLAYIL